jgi:transposase-like protein
VCFDRGGWSPALFADITETGFGVLTWRKGPAPDLPGDAFTTITCTDDRGRAHEYDLADTTAALGISEGPRKGQAVTLRQVTRRVPARHGGTRQIHALTSRDDLTAGEVCWRLSSRWREENYFRYARTRFALDALDSYAAAPDDPDRMVPNPARKTAAARVRQAEAAAQAAEAARDAALLQLRSPAPGQAAYLTNQVINALAAPVEAACREVEEADTAAAAVPARVPLGTLAPDMVRLDAETKQITHAIRMAAYNAETTLARALDGHYARAGDEAYALIREALTTSGDIFPGHGELLIRLDPLTAPRRTQALAALCDQLTAARACYPGTGLVLRYEVKPHPNPA